MTYGLNGVKGMNGVIDKNPKVLEGFSAPGVKPALQTRSREVMIRMFNEGIALLQEYDFDELSVDLICERSDATTGAFYNRFEGKESYVNALQRIVVEVTRDEVISKFADNTWATCEELVEWIARYAAHWYQRHEGIVRALLRRAKAERDDAWAPLNELGRLFVRCALPRILSFWPEELRSEISARSKLAFQMLFGTFNNMVLVDPGPYSLRDPDAAAALADAMMRLIRPAAPADSRSSTRQRRK